MSIRRPTELETFRVLYMLWKHHHISNFDMSHFLLVEHGVRLLKISEEGIEAESIDKKVKYSIK